MTEPAPDAPPPATPARRLAALGVHLFTASGAALGLMALLAAVEHDFPKMFWWLGAALVVDGVDGALARKADAKRALPGVSGDTLDLVVDYVTYVLVPAYALAVSGLMPAGFGAPAAALILVTSALYFAIADMKTDDWYFRGFPAIWNVAAFYLLVLSPAPAVALGVVVALAALTFAPIAFVHPVRVRRLRPLTLAATFLWSIFAVVAVAQRLDPDAIVIAALCALGLYFVTLGLLRGRSKNRQG